MYILGRPVTIQPDRQPLVKIFQKLGSWAFSDITILCRKASQKDPDIEVITQYIVSGWPSKFDAVLDNLKIYGKYNGLVLRNDQILIPQSLWKDILERPHQYHSGIEVTIQLAKDIVFWPGIRDHI